MAEELVRLVGESIRQNWDMRYINGKRTIKWGSIANQMSLLNGFQLRPDQIRKKWENMVDRLFKDSLEEEDQMQGKNGYVLIC